MGHKGVRVESARAAQELVLSRHLWLAKWEGLGETHGGPPCRHHPRDGGFLFSSSCSWNDGPPLPVLLSQSDCSTLYISLPWMVEGEVMESLYWISCN